MIVTFDLFSALLDTRSGASGAFDGLAASRGWAVSGSEVYDRWDAHNKAAQLELADRLLAGGEWKSFTFMSTRTLGLAYDDLGIDSDHQVDMRTVHESIPGWAPWPDVVPGLAGLSDHHRLGILSNVDDALFARTQVAGLVDPDLVLTSERLRAYKPGAQIYRRAAERTGGHVHVAASARDVRGSLEAGLTTVRVARPGHRVDPEGPQPSYQIESLAELGATLAEI
ncbi:HAD family hydrolase [Solicola gregarius]|uniref:Haloacid dehalogenase n=1 Tax=Solicola gregarius TaxID=2908642 RepID=A0AA46YP47_9ACTN|nr:hypothetical protein [Solicola gregarius]UYM07273.1 hypothetical protein L0C25_09415 [Solicola gregarius]